jgi:CRP-like cAMP-binding protein
MIKPQMLEHPKLKKWVREFSAGEYLFEEQQQSEAMYLITEGTLSLWRQSPQGHKRLVGTIHAPGSTGETALLSDRHFKRTFSAQAKTNIVALEVDSRAFRIVQTLIPEITLQILKALGQQLCEANTLIDILLLPNEIDRITQYLLHHFKHNKQGKQTLLITIDDICAGANTDAIVTQNALECLLRKNILAKNSGGYALIDESGLVQYVPELHERLAA